MDSDEACEVCGEGLNTGSKYCSRDCMAESFKKDRVEVECRNCGDVFEEFPSNSDRKYCSQECANEYKRTEGARGESHWLYERDETECKNCGESFEHIPSKEREFCGHDCRGSWDSENREYPTGADSPNWKGGATDEVKRLRTSKKYYDFKERILERDGYNCQDCGSTENLHMHHIEPICENILRIFDPENVVILCRDCHSERHPGVHLM